MYKGQKLARNSDRIKFATEFWLRVATDFNAGMSPKDITKRYINPKTKRPYQLTHIHWILRQLRLRKVN